MSDDNLSKLKAAYRRWNDSKGDREVWRDILADKISLRTAKPSAPALGFTRDSSSREEVLDYLAGVLREWEMIHYTPETFVSEGDLIAMFGHLAYRNKATGKVAEARTSSLWRFEEGKAVSMIEIYDSATALAAATAD
jgi:ketosteroid isomerase-like protein